MVLGKHSAVVFLYVLQSYSRAQAYIAAQGESSRVRLLTVLILFACLYVITNVSLVQIKIMNK